MDPIFVCIPPHNEAQALVFRYVWKSAVVLQHVWFSCLIVDVNIVELLDKIVVPLPQGHYEFAVACVDEHHVSPGTLNRAP